MSLLKPLSWHKSGRVQFKLDIRLSDTGEIFTVRNCCRSMTMNELKTKIELIAGIPTDFQRLSYLDQGDLMNETTIRFNYIMPGATLFLAVWPYNSWPELVKAAVSGDLQRLKSAVFKPGSLKPWLFHCLFSALFISAHRGHLAAVRFLIQKGADVNGRTLTGRRPFHAAAAKGHLHCLQELYAAGAHLNLSDCDGHTALDVACLFEQRRSTQQIFYLQWQERAASVSLKRHLHETDLFPHQCFDSKLHTWRRGACSQIYMAELKK